MQSIDDVNTNVGTSINEILNSAGKDLSVFAATRLFQNYVTLDEIRYDTHQPQVYIQLLQYQDAHPEYFLMQLVLSDGQVDSSVDNRESVLPVFSVADWRFFQEFESVNTGETKYHMDFEPTLQKFIISLSTPMKYSSLELDDTTQNPRATYFSLSMYADRIAALLSKRLNLTNIPLVIVTQDNQIIAHATNDEFTVAELNNANIFGVKTPTQVFIDQRSYLLVPYKLAAGMTLYSVMPNSILNQTARTLFIEVTLFLILFILIISGLGFFILNRFILKPISSMQLLVTDIAEGKMNTVAPVVNSKDELGFLLHALVDMRDNINASQNSTKQLAFFDSLTNLPNRSTFQTQLDYSIVCASKAQERFAVVFIDLDNFKKVNDTLGHDAGDELLLSASSRIKKALSIPQYTLDNVTQKSNKTIFLARLGGDEFTMLIPVNKTKEEVRIRLMDVVQTLSVEFNLGGDRVNIGASIGVAFYPSSANNAKDLLKSADLAMYDAKRQGTNKIVFYYPQLRQTLVNANKIEIILREAIETEDFSFDFHPRMNLRDYSIKGFEIDLNWRHPKLAKLSSTQLYAYLRINGKLHLFSHLMIKKATAKMKQWLSLGYKNCSVAINVSSAQLEEPEFVATIENALNEAKIPSKYLIIEFTISSAFRDSEKVITTLHQLNELGISITLNEFAQGLASFQHLRDLPINQIKLEETFVSDAVQGNFEFLRALISFTKGLDIDCIVEGVTTSTRHDALLLSGCEYAQGPYYAKPLSEAHVDNFIESLHDKNNSVGPFLGDK
ncbi:MAG: diguanylate cyclase (GGDEF)-like protein [Alphaproteobacteria bacterium]|jgi:diguanylate cyclase (GGDEF)-like protein